MNRDTRSRWARRRCLVDLADWVLFADASRDSLRHEMITARRPMRRDRLIQHRLLRTTPLVAVGTSGVVGTRMMRSSGLGHSLTRANRVPVSRPQGFPTLESSDEGGVAG